MRIGSVVGIACVMLLAAPAAAWAVPGLDAPATLSTVTGALTLLLAAALVITVAQLRRVASGSAIAGNIACVVAATLCLAFAVLLGFVDRFVGVVSADQVRAGSDVLVFVSMLFFALYFNAVRHALVSFLSGVSAGNDEAMRSERELVEANTDAYDG